MISFGDLLIDVAAIKNFAMRPSQALAIKKPTAALTAFSPRGAHEI
jgi:hypothetical protein